MTSSSPAGYTALLGRTLLALLTCATTAAWAGLGEGEHTIETERIQMHARRVLSHAAQYTVHELSVADGSRVRQYVAGNGRVFAVSWVTLYKPDLSSLLGSSFGSYAQAAQLAAQRGGLQRQFRHEAGDLVVQSGGHLHVYTGYAYRRELLPAGLSVQSLGLAG